MKIYRWWKSFRFETTNPFIIKRYPIRFTSWKDAKNYLNKEIVICFVEDADVSGIMDGIKLEHNSKNEVIDCLVGIDGKWYSFYRGRPK